MEGINGITHPLQTPIILEQIFGNLEFKDLKASRRVCKEWRSSSSKFFRPLTKIKIWETKSKDKRFSYRKLPNFLNLMLKKDGTLSEQPLSNHFCLSGTTAVKTEMLVNEIFWKNFGLQIHTLELKKVKFLSPKSFNTVVFQECPNLGKLVISEVSVEGSRPKIPLEWVPPQFPPNIKFKALKCNSIDSTFCVGAMDLIAHFPSLESLDLIDVFDKSFTIHLLSSLMIARKQNKNCVNIKHLTFNLAHIKGFPDLISFIGMDIPLLDTLGIKLEYNETIEIGKKILIGHARALKKLHIRSHYDMDRAINAFLSSNNVIFDNLEELKINSLNINSTTFPFTTPKLESLLLLNVYEFSVNHIQDHLSYPSCHQLLLNNASVITPEDLVKLGRWFPNLRTLRICHLDNETFSTVCQQWPDLTHLEVLNGSMDDSGISGLSAEDVAEINRVGETGSWTPISDPRPNLYSLKSLETLYLHFKTSHYPGYCTAAYGVSKLANLKHFSIRHKFPGIPDQLWSKLVAKYSSSTKAFMQALDDTTFVF